MSLSTTPAPARTDAPRAAAETTTRPVASTRLVRRAGVAVATGAGLWATGLLAFGLNAEEGWRSALEGVSSLMFQLGLVALVTVQLRTGATGTGRLARFFLHLEHVLLGLAITSTLAYVITPGSAEEAWFLALDVFWPLSMLGMAAIGVRIAIAGRWKGLARFWPLGAESWAPVVIPLAAIVSGAASFVAAGHLLVGYAMLGVILARRPELTGARDS